ncbi:MAG: BON domain-containing protein [Gammaproteobacteria bacterium]
MRRTLLTLSLAITLLSGCTTPGGISPSPIASPYDRRSHEAIYSDTEIERNFRSEMERREDLSEPTHVNLHAYNGLALLTGETPTEPLHEWAVNLARIIPGVKQVHDYILIGAPSSEASRRIDALLHQSASNAVLQMQPIRGFHPSQIDIVVERGTVYLLGLVRRTEADTVVKKIRTVQGVNGIVKVFTYIN